MQFFPRFMTNFTNSRTSPTKTTRNKTGNQNGHEKCDKEIVRSKSTATHASIFIASECSKNSGRHVDGLHFADRGALSQIVQERQKGVIDLISKKPAPTEQSYTSSDEKLLVLTFFERFGSYLEKSQFENITNLQVLR